MKKLLRLCLVLVLVIIMSTGTSLSALAAQMTLPAALKTIEAEAFEGSEAIDEVVLPEGITSIGSRAFADSSLTEITLPMSLASIAADAFEGSPYVRALVKYGSYALDWCIDNNIPYVITNASEYAGGAAVSISASASTVAMGESVKITFAADNEEDAEADGYVEASFVYLNEAGEVVGAENRGHSLGRFNFSPRCGGAVKLLITINDGEDFCAGATPSVEIDLTGGDTYVYYKVSFVGNPYPGGKMRVYATAVNGQYMSGSEQVTFTDASGLVNEVLGTLSADNTSIAVDVDIPEDCLDKDGNWIEYNFSLNIGDTVYRTYTASAAPCDESYYLYVGNLADMDCTIIPAEMPYTYAIEDTSVATVEDGVITGVSVGTTSGTLTTASGYVREFEVTVEEAPSASGSQPVLYTYAVSETVKEGSDNVLFYVYSTLEDTLGVDASVDFSLRFYDINMNLLEILNDSSYFSSDEREEIRPDWEWYSNRAGDAYRYMEIDLAASGYEVCEPSTALIRVIRASEQGELNFSVERNGVEVNPGDTVSTTVTCLTPELLEGVTADDPVKVYPSNSSSYAYDLFTDYEPAIFYEGKVTGTVTLTVGTEVVAGRGYNVPMYCGTKAIDTFYYNVADSVSAKYTSLYMMAGDSRTLPLTIDEEEITYIRYTVEDPTVASIADGVVTALAAGETEIRVNYMDGYGQTSSRWFYIDVAEPAAENLPTLSISIDADSVKFGKSVPATFKLSECIYDENGDPAEIRVAINAYYLDSQQRSLDNDSEWLSFMADELVDGIVADVNIWYMYSSGVYQASYVTCVPRYVDNVTDYRLSFEEKTLTITDAPDPEVLTYGMICSDDTEIQQGGYVYMQVWRNQSDIGSDAEISIIDEDGNVLSTETYEDGSFQSGISVVTDGLSIGTHTLTLKVDGTVYSDASIEIEVTESRLYISGLYNREAVGNIKNVSYYFNADDYDCPATVSVSDPSIATVSGSKVTFISGGYVTVSVTCEHGQTASRDVIVYDPDNSVFPTFYLEPYSEDYEAEWMEYVDVILGTTTDLTLIDEQGSYSITCDVEFLDENDNVVAEGGVYLRHNLLEAESETRWNDSDLWLSGALAEAVAVRMDISADAGKVYYVDPDRCTVTYPLPSISTYPYPLVVYSYSDAVEAGGDLTVTFECLNPDVLGSGGAKVQLCDSDDYDNIYAGGMLTKDQPVVTLTYTVAEDFTGGYFAVCYPRGDYSTYDSFHVTLGKINSFGEDSKIDVGYTRYLYVDYDGYCPELTFSSSDESVVSIVGTYDRYVVVEGKAVGSADISATTAGGVSYSCRVVVYDSENAVTPAIGFAEVQPADTLGWGDYLYLNVVTTTSPEQFGAFGLNYRMDYLDDQGNVVASYEDSSWPNYDFARSEDMIYFAPDKAEMALAYVAGARSVRVTIDDEDCTVISGQESVTLKIMDPNDSENLILYMVAPQYVVADAAFDVTVACLNPGKMVEGDLYKIGGSDLADIELTLTAESPSATVSVMIPASYSNYYSYSLNAYRNNSRVASTSVQLVTGRLNEFSSAIKVGNTGTLNYSVRNISGLTVTFESSNTAVATVDSTGVVTGVAPGLADISLIYGPLVKTITVRVYSSSVEGVPEFSLFDADAGIAVMPNSYHYIGVSITDNIESMGYSKTLNYTIDFIDDAGEVVHSISDYDYLYFENGAEDAFYFNNSTALCSAVMKGAKQIVITITDVPDSYTIGSVDSVTLDIADISEWSGTYFGFGYDQIMYAGQEQTVNVRMLSASESYKGVNCTVSFRMYDGNRYFVDSEAVTISSDAPDAQFAFTIPEDATRLNVSYTVKFEGSTGNYTSSSFAPTLVRILNTQSDKVLSIGGTMMPSYRSSNSEALTYESSNSGVATVDSTGLVTAVSTGVTTITASLGPISRSFNVRVYDPDAEHATPELYLTNPDPDQTVYYYENYKIGIGTHTDVSELGGSFYVRLEREYVDDDGNVVYGSTSTNSFNVTFCADEVYTYSTYLYNEFYNAVMAGATHLRYTLISYNNNYTIDESANSILLPFRDPSEWNATKVCSDKPAYMFHGEPMTVTMKLLSCSESDADGTFTLKFTAYDNNGTYYFENAEQTVSEASPVVTYTTSAIGSDVTQMNFSYQVYREGASYSFASDSWSATPVAITSVQKDMLLKIGNSFYVSYGGNNLSYVERSYESSNSEVATVNSEGRVTGVSAGSAQITAHFGSLSHTFNVRVYDSSVSCEDPDIYITDSDTHASADDSGYVYLMVGTNTPVDELGSSVYVSFDCEYLDDENNAILTMPSTPSAYASFVVSETEVSLSLSNFNHAVAAGATKIRLSLRDVNSYTIDAERNTVTVPILDTSEWTGTEFGMDADNIQYGGDEVTVNVKMLSCSDSDAGKELYCEFYVSTSYSNYVYKSERMAISAANPQLTFTFEVPSDYSGFNVGYCIYSSATASYSRFSDSIYCYIVRVTSEQVDVVLPVGGTKTASFSVTNGDYVEKRYESSNTDVVTVSDTGVMTGVAVGTATVTAYYGTLPVSVDVRVYDSASMVTANLSLSTPEGMTEWSWDLCGDLILSADQPVENLGSGGKVNIYTYFYDAEDTVITYVYNYCPFNFIDSNTVTITLDIGLDADELRDSGVISVSHSISSLTGTVGFAIDDMNAEVNLPMAA